jgi:hypothetical protein
MEAWEVEAYIDDLNLRPLYQRDLNGRQLGVQMHLSNADRERWRVWNIAPFDKTGEEFAELAKIRERERRARKRRENNVRTRDQYLADLRAKPKPWEAEGVSRRTWYRRKHAALNVARGESETIVNKLQHYLVPPQQRGCHEGVTALTPTIPTEERVVERLAPSLRAKRTHLVPPSEERKWTKPTILSDEPRDLREFPLLRMAS